MKKIVCKYLKTIDGIELDCLTIGQVAEYINNRLFSIGLEDPYSCYVCTNYNDKIMIIGDIEEYEIKIVNKY